MSRLVDESCLARPECSLGRYISAPLRRRLRSPRRFQCPTPKLSVKLLLRRSFEASNSSHANGTVPAACEHRLPHTQASSQAFFLFCAHPHQPDPSRYAWPSSPARPPAPGTGAGTVPAQLFVCATTPASPLASSYDRAATPDCSNVHVEMSPLWLGGRRALVSRKSDRGCRQRASEPGIRAGVPPAPVGPSPSSQADKAPSHPTEHGAHPAPDPTCRVAAPLVRLPSRCTSKRLNRPVPAHPEGQNGASGLGMVAGMLKASLPGVPRESSGTATLATQLLILRSDSGRACVLSLRVTGTWMTRHVCTHSATRHSRGTESLHVWVGDRVMRHAPNNSECGNQTDDDVEVLVAAEYAG
jgi:hypothetical protein